MVALWNNAYNTQSCGSARITGGDAGPCRGFSGTIVLIVAPSTITAILRLPPPHKKAGISIENSSFFDACYDNNGE